MRYIFTILIIAVIFPFAASAKNKPVDSVSIKLTSPIKDAIVDSGKLPTFTWELTGGTKTKKYTLIITEVKTGQSAEAAMKNNSPLFVKKRIKKNNFTYPSNAKKLQPGNTYAWQIVQKKGRKAIYSPAGTFSYGNQKIDLCIRWYITNTIECIGLDGSGNYLYALKPVITNTYPDPTVGVITSWTATIGDATIVSPNSIGSPVNMAPGTVTAIPSPYIPFINPTNTGYITVTYTLWGGHTGYNCTYTLQVPFTRCCTNNQITMFTLAGIPLTDPLACVQPGSYTFKLNPQPTPGTIINYSMVTVPGNVPIISPGTFPYGISGHTFTVPLYNCNTTGFKLTYTWNNHACTAVIQRNICAPPCCDFVTPTTHTRSGTLFNASFVLNPPFTTFLKIKVQILEVSQGGIPIPNANLNIISETLGGPLQAGYNVPAITSPGNALWFDPVTFNSSGNINFLMNLIHAGSTPSSVHLKVRFTFYKNNGVCPTEICERDVDYIP